MFNKERPKEIHKTPCRHCPSEWFPMDEEAEMLIQETIKGKMAKEDLFFTCAWRKDNQICRGLWNRYQERLGVK